MPDRLPAPISVMVPSAHGWIGTCWPALLVPNHSKSLFVEIHTLFSSGVDWTYVLFQQDLGLEQCTLNKPASRQTGLLYLHRIFRSTSSVESGVIGDHLSKFEAKVVVPSLLYVIAEMV